MPTLLVLNKADRLTQATRDALERELPAALVMSALENADGQRLRTRIDSFFEGRLDQDTLVVPYAKAGILAEFRDRLQVIDEAYGEAITVTVRGTPPVLAQVKARLA